MTPRRQGTPITVAIPALDEIENLRFLLPQLSQIDKLLTNVNLRVIVVVGVDCPADEITEIQRLGASVVKRTPSNSFGDAIRTAIASSANDSDFVVFMDADGSHSPKQIPVLLDHIHDADVVIASRYVQGGSSDNGIVLRAMSIALNRAYAIVLGIDCKDISTNFKVYRSSDLTELSLTCDNFDIVEELLFGVRTLKYPVDLRIVEIPDHFAQRRSGETKRRLGVYIASYIWTLWNLRRQRQSTQTGLGTNNDTRT